MPLDAHARDLIELCAMVSPPATIGSLRGSSAPYNGLGVSGHHWMRALVSSSYRTRTASHDPGVSRRWLTPWTGTRRTRRGARRPLQASCAIEQHVTMPTQQDKRRPEGLLSTRLPVARGAHGASAALHGCSFQGPPPRSVRSHGKARLRMSPPHKSTMHPTVRGTIGACCPTAAGCPRGPQSLPRLAHA